MNNKIKVRFPNFKNNLDEKYYEIMSKIYSSSSNNTEKKNIHVISRSEIGDFSYKDALELSDAYIFYEIPEEESFQYIKWILSISSDEDKVSFQINEDIFSFIEECKLSFEELFL